MSRSKTGAFTGSAAAVAASWILAGLAAFSGLGAGIATAQEAVPPAAPADSFSAAIEVELLDLQVVVTDEEGRRVSGLPPTAFRILVDGEEAPIALFAEVGGPEAATVADRVPALPPAAVSGAGGSAAVNYLVFIDDLMTLESRRNAVLARLRADLELLRPGDRMAVVRLARHRKLQVLADWSSDRAVLAAALDRALELPSWGIKYIALRRMDSYVANWEGNETRRSVLAAAGAMRLLERPGGRRALLLVAGSWDPAELQRADRFSPWCVTGECQGSGVYDVLTDTANLLGYAIYAIDVEGRDPDDDWGREKRLQAVLAELARVTGGRRLLNADRLRVLATAIEDTRSYYAIGVTPPPGMAQRRAAVSIEVLRSGLSARSQTAFVPVSPEHDRELDVLNALWLEEGAAASPLRLALDHVERLGGGRVGLMAHLVLPADLLAWRARGSGLYADVTVEIASVDWGGDSSAVAERRLRLFRDAGEAGTRLVIPWPLELRRRRHTIVAGLRDRLAGTSYTVVAELAPRDAPRPPDAVPSAAVAAASQQP